MNNKPTARQLKKEQTKALLINTAFDIFSSQGFLNTRMSDIAKAAGVSHGTVFLHFNTQEEFIAEVVNHFCSKIALRTHELSESSSSLKELLIAHLDAITEYEAFYTRLVIESRMLSQEVRDTFIIVQSAISLHFSRVLEKNRKTSISPAVLFNMWIGLIHHYLLNGDVFAPEGSVIATYKSALTDAFVSLLA
ncbi:MAG: regulatory protein TetR [Anaerocolumna sp.]|nr:regulatory protein TetR [Anaerocolumna sp.]